MKPGKALLSIFFALVLFVVPFVADAQQAGKVPTLGYLSQYSGPAGPPSTSIKAFLEGLKELGYVEGKNIAIEYRYTEGKIDRLPEVAAELARLKVDIIVVETGMAAGHAKKATQTIPIVMEASGDAVSQGLVASLAQPGGNVTGLTALSPTTIGKQLQLLSEVVPNLTHVGVLWDGVSSPLRNQAWAETRAAAQPLKVQLYSLKASGPGEFPGAFAEAARQNVQAVLMFDISPWMTRAGAAQLVELAIQHRLPMMFPFPFYAGQGGLMGYGVNVPELSRRAASYVDRILKGAKPADLAVGQPTKFDLVINLKAAKAIGLTIPQPVLSQADRVIE
jgi:putative ABC transport system substrate-binding protein